MGIFSFAPTDFHLGQTVILKLGT